MNYNMNVVDRGAVRFVFVTRGRSKPFDDTEVKDFFATKGNRYTEGGSYAKPDTEKRWAGIPDNKQRKIMFMKDLKMGIDFCVSKYAATKEEILAEAQRIAPFFNVGK